MQGNKNIILVTLDHQQKLYPISNELALNGYSFESVMMKHMVINMSEARLQTLKQLDAFNVMMPASLPTPQCVPPQRIAHRVALAQHPSL